MILTEHAVGNAKVVEVAGRIDSPNSVRLHQQAGAAIGTSAVLVLDLAKVEYITSAGFRVLLLLGREADKAGSRLVLCGIQGKVRQLFDLGGFLDVFPIVQTREEGIAGAR